MIDATAGSGASPWGALSETLGSTEVTRRRLLLPQALTASPQVIRLYARLPHRFRKKDVDSILGDVVSRDMKWRYLKRMETVGLVKHASRKTYEKLYDRYSQWVEATFLPTIRSMEMSI